MALNYIRRKLNDAKGNTFMKGKTILLMSIIWGKFYRWQRGSSVIRRNITTTGTVLSKQGSPSMGELSHIHNYNRWDGSWNPFFDCYHTFIVFNPQKVRNGITCYQMSCQFLKSVPPNGIVPLLLLQPQKMPNIPL